MNINRLSLKEQELLTCIDTYIEQIHKQSEQPATIKRNDLEEHIESKAEMLSFQFKKEAASIQTYYTFFLEQQDVQVELFYRYQNYYTRHSIKPL
jgi:hypothetical protein